VSRLTRLNQSEVDYNDALHVARLQSLQAVDELVGGVVDKLEALGLAENTYVIYTSDNGFHIGQHRLRPGKSCAYEEDVNVPMLIRGPGVPKRHEVNFTTSHTDVSFLEHPPSPSRLGFQLIPSIRGVIHVADRLVITDIRDYSEPRQNPSPAGLRRHTHSAHALGYEQGYELAHARPCFHRILGRWRFRR
jgi:hypothetical protein